MRSPTQYKFRHYTTDPESGVEYLLWASNGRSESIEVPKLYVVKGSALDLELAGDQAWSENALVDEGEVDMLDVYFGAQAVRGSLYFRLYNDTPVEADTLATLAGEVTGSGYGPITLTRGTDWGAITAAAGTTSVVKTFTATGSWTVATELVLATVGTGTAGLFIASAPLSVARTLVNTDTLDVTMAASLE